jgi:beta-lactam-binding protein with PASTA domain
MLLNGRTTRHRAGVVPDVVGMTQADAREAIEAEGLRFNFAGEEPNEEYEAGEAIRSEPVADAEVEPDSTVNVSSPTGAAEFGIPEVEGLTQDRARQLMEDRTSPSPGSSGGRRGVERDGPCAPIPPPASRHCPAIR